MSNVRGFACALVWVGLAAAMLPAAEPALRVVQDDAPRPVAVELVGLSLADLRSLRQMDSGESSVSRVLRVYVAGSSKEPDSQELAGRHEVIGEALRFTPQFAFRAGTSYEAVSYLPVQSTSASPVRKTLEFKIPSPPPAEPTRVVAIYPSSDTLPDNHLRFYLHFSAPMSFGQAYSHVKLLASDGSEVTRAFLEIGEELWDSAGMRLTILFDPGRVKKGLSPREEFGPILVDGKSYRLIINETWRDANGNPLAANFEKAFRALPPIETAVDAKKWRIAAPRPGTRDPLVIHFDRPLDRALIQRMISVAGSDGKLLTGEIQVRDNEQRWELRPDRPWQAGPHTLVVDTALEDSAGNNLARPFEVDVFDRVDKSSAPELLKIPIDVKN